MTCEHLRALEEAILAAGIRETFRGEAWSKNCREWVYFEAYLDPAGVRRAFALPDCVEDHVHRGTHDGSERGFVCTEHRDGVLGRFEPANGVRIFP